MSTAYCPMCDTENEPMGVLGNRLHYRCRGCGAGFSKLIGSEE